jgi:hypothetical protein
MTPTRLEINASQKALLETNKGARDGTIPHRNPDFAQHTLRIPMEHFTALTKLYPGLVASDPAEKSAAWEAFHNSPFAEPYRVNKLSRGYLHNGIIIK